jgi:4a-hydroxytetrahydrobiopterin dehydratase
MNAWREDRGALVRDFKFRDFEEAKAFADWLAERVEDYHRHPDLVVSGNRVRVMIANLHHGGITLAEERLAAKVDAALAEQAR